MEDERRALLEAYRGGAERLAAVVARIPAGRLDEATEGGWSARRIVCHLADADVVGAHRMRIAVAEPGSAVAPFKPDAWAGALPTEGVSPELAIEAMRGVRAFTAAMLAALPDEAWARTVEHPVYGTMPLTAIVRTFTHHVDEHLIDVQRIADGA